MLRTLTPGRIFAAAVIAASVVLISPSSASAHAGIEASSPANGAQLSSAPKAVVLTFEEHVSLAGTGTRLVDGNGKVVPATATAVGERVTIVPKAQLGMGRYAASWRVLSHDGDVVTGAISFTVDQPNPTGAPVTIPAKPNVPTTLSAALAGSRTLTMVTKADEGDIEWSSPRIPGPIVWELEGNGTTGKATGVLPTAGKWTFVATLEMANDAIVVVTGSVRIK